MRICLVNPPNIVWRQVGFSGVFQPLGLAHIAAVLAKNGYEVSILDALALGWDKYTNIDKSTRLLGLTYNEITDRVREISPDIVGISALFSSQSSSAFGTASAVKRANQNIITVLGGAHASVKPLDCLNCSDVDISVMGEGELTMLDLVQTLESEEYDKLSEILGIAYRENGVPRLNKPRSPISDLDSIPFPARHLLPLEKYYEAARAARSERLAMTYNKKWTRMITSRGCPFQCVFCSIYLHMGRRWRFRSPENMVDEIEEVVNRYGIKFITFEDDNMTLDRQRMIRICDLIRERRLDIEWNTPNGIRADTLDEDVLIKMKDAGCKQIYVSPESGNQGVVNEIIKKKQDLTTVAEVVRLCKKIGIRVDCFFVIGLIGETKENIRETIDFARKLRKLGASNATFSIAAPYYGTELYEQAKKQGYLISERDEQMHIFTPQIETPEFSLGDLKRLYKEGIKVNPLIPRDDLGLALKIAVRDPIRAIKLAIGWLKGEYRYA